MTRYPHHPIISRRIWPGIQIIQSNHVGYRSEKQHSRATHLPPNRPQTLKHTPTIETVACRPPHQNHKFIKNRLIVILFHFLFLNPSILFLNPVFYQNYAFAPKFYKMQIQENFSKNHTQKMLQNFITFLKK